MILEFPNLIWIAVPWLNAKYQYSSPATATVLTIRGFSSSPPQLRLWQWQRIVIAGAGIHDDVIKWKHFPRYWHFVRGIHRSPVNSPSKGLWRGALMFSLICVSINDWVNNREAGELRRHRGHYDVTVMKYPGHAPMQRLSYRVQWLAWYRFNIKIFAFPV